MFKVQELIQWLGITAFEILTYLIGLVAFTILLTLHVSYGGSNYFNPSEIKLILMPLFAADLWNAYFCLIVFIRTYMDKNIKAAIFGALWSFFLIGDLVLFKFLLYQKLIGLTTLEYSEVVSPIILLLQLIAIRACQTR